MFCSVQKRRRLAGLGAASLFVPPRNSPATFGQDFDVDAIADGAPHLAHAQSAASSAKQFGAVVELHAVQIVPGFGGDHAQLRHPQIPLYAPHWEFPWHTFPVGHVCPFGKIEHGAFHDVVTAPPCEVMHGIVTVNGGVQ
jgi:hypothetical protein